MEVNGDHATRGSPGPSRSPRPVVEDAAMATTIGALTRRTAWEQCGETSLQFDAHHPQGMVRVGALWWVSTVDIDNRRGAVLAVDANGTLVDRVDVGDGVRFHPGGLDFDGEALWVAAAEYRPTSSAAIVRLVPGESPEHVFDVADHVGAIARCGPDGDLVGWSWGSRVLYRWSVDGTLVASALNPSFFVDFQDLQWLGTGHFVCGGVSSLEFPGGRRQLGGIALLDAETLCVKREVPFPHHSTVTGRAATANPLFVEVVDGALVAHVLPDDGFGTIVSYRSPLHVPNEDPTMGAHRPNAGESTTPSG